MRFTLGLAVVGLLSLMVSAAPLGLQERDSIQNSPTVTTVQPVHAPAIAASLPSGVSSDEENENENEPNENEPNENEPNENEPNENELDENEEEAEELGDAAPGAH